MIPPLHIFPVLVTFQYRQENGHVYQELFLKLQCLVKREAGSQHIWTAGNRAKQGCQWIQPWRDDSREAWLLPFRKWMNFFQKCHLYLINRTRRLRVPCTDISALIIADCRSIETLILHATAHNSCDPALLWKAFFKFWLTFIPQEFSNTLLAKPYRNLWNPSCANS